MLIEPLARHPGSAEADPPADRMMLALQYVVALIAVVAAGLLGALH